VHYFSSAGNGSSQQAFAAPLRTVNTTAGSNIKLAGVDRKLYAGGFEDFDQGFGTAIAQDMVLGGDPTSDDGGSDGILDLQWGDPVDPNGAPRGGDSADELGPVVSFPSGFPTGSGMVYTARTSAQKTIVGTIRNRIGAGWTPVDGYGYLNAELAVDH
jgi:hypothetical protein